MYLQTKYTTKNHKELNQHAQDGTSDIKYYRRKQQITFHPLTKYSDRESYRQRGHALIYSS